MVASESDVDREVGEQVGHLGSVAKLGRRLCAGAHTDAVGLVGLRSSGTGAPNALGGSGVQVGTMTRRPVTSTSALGMPQRGHGRITLHTVDLR